MLALLQQHWLNATSRERLLVVSMAAVIFFAAVFALLIRPAWRTVQAAPATLNALDNQVLTMRAQAAQLRATPATGVAPTMAATSPALSAERELASPGATITETRDSANITTLNLKGVEGTRLAVWLSNPALQKRLQRLSVTRDATSGRVTGTVVLRAPRSL